MSFIGPRVVGSGEIRLREHAVRKRYNVRPGLICLWWIRRRVNIAYGNRPFIPHVGQYLTHQGVTDFYFVLSHLPEKLETLLGDGQRWDSTFRYHLIRDPDHPYQNLKHILLPDTPIMLAHGDRLPECHIPYDQNDSVVFCHTPEPNGTKKWTGWARLTPSNYATLPGNMDEGIWISRNVNLHPTACLTPPLFIGENSRIGPGVQLGPNAIVSHDGILDSQCRAENALIFRGSYIGESLELDGVIVDRNRLINVRVGATVSMADNFILGSLSDGQMKHWTRRKLAQLIAVILIIGTWPILLLTAFCLKVTRRGPVLYKTEAVILPAASQAGGMAHVCILAFPL